MGQFLTEKKFYLVFLWDSINRDFNLIPKIGEKREICLGDKSKSTFHVFYTFYHLILSRNFRHFPQKIDFSIDGDST